MSTKTKQNTTTGGSHPMTHHETHGKNCICHSCHPLIDALREARIARALEMTEAAIDSSTKKIRAALKGQPRGARPMTERVVIFNADDAELIADVIEALTDEQLAERLGLTDLLVAAAQIAGERRFLR